MKSNLVALSIACITGFCSQAQNVGINTNTPAAQLDVNGDIALRIGNITLPNSTNADVNTTTNKKSIYRVSIAAGLPPLGASISGFNGGADGRVVTLINTSTSQLTFENDGAGNQSVPANRMITNDGNSLSIPANGAVTIVYDGAASRWRISTYSKPAPFAADPLWYSNGNSDMYNLNNGNVGIGTVNPQAKFDLTGDLRLRSALLNLPAGLNNDVDINTVKSSVYLLAGGALNGCQITGFAGGIDGRYITLFNNSSIAALQLYDESNNTNTSSPANKILTGTGNSAIVYQNGSVTLRYDGSKQRWTVVSSNYTDGLGLGNGSGAGWGISGNAGTTVANFIGTTDSNPFVIKTNNTAAINISTDGNIGMGVSPGSAAKLWISGSDNSIFMYGGTGAYTGRIGTEAANMVVEADGDLLIKSALGAPLINRPSKNILLNPPTTNIFNTVGNVGIGTASPANKLSVAGNADFSGNVGIGTTNPTSKLSVNGNIRAKEIVVELANWPDYVFEDNYLLPSLDSVARQIKYLKHLPGMPSAENILQQGLSLGTIQTKMMEKIEELTLYVIELKKEMELLKAKK